MKADDFHGRVAYAARCFLRGTQSRAFDSCFEMYDGDLVVTALVRRCATDANLRRAVERDYSGMLPESWQQAAQKHKDTKRLGVAARTMRLNRGNHERGPKEQ